MLGTGSHSDGLLAVAPMMDYTHRFQRFLMRKLTRRATLYTEMVTANTIVHCKPQELDRFLRSEPNFNPTVLQLGGADPDTLNKAVTIALPYNFDAINLNCGCPSDRVAGSGCFGAALMRTPKLVAECCGALAAGAQYVPITVKIRIGVADSASEAINADEDTLYDDLACFVDTVRQSGVGHFAIHARQAVLGGLSPAQNREIPPLRHAIVHRLASEFPDVSISLNGGIKDINGVNSALSLHAENQGKHNRESLISGVMVGRAAVQRPWEWAVVDTDIYGERENPCPNRRCLLEEYAKYAESIEKSHPQRLRNLLLSPVVNLFAAEPRGKKFRAALDSLQSEDLCFSDHLMRAADTLLPETLDACPGSRWLQSERCYATREELAPTD